MTMAGSGCKAPGARHWLLRLTCRPGDAVPPSAAVRADVLRVGLTGGIGAGKSEVSKRLAAQGAVVIDADLIAREVVAPGTDGLTEVVEAFGPGVLGTDGELDRVALGDIVFADKEKLANAQLDRAPAGRGPDARARGRRYSAAQLSCMTCR